MKIKFLLILAFCSQILFAQLSDLTRNVMHQLKIDEDDCDGSFAEMQLPYNSDETVIVIPKIGHQEEDYSILDSYVVLVNNKNHEIKSLFYESYKTSGWESDAIFIYEIVIDTTSYLVKKNTNAFGVILKSKSMSQPNPYYNFSLSLFVPDGKELKNILKNYPIYESIGETDMKSYAQYEIEDRQISFSTNITNGFFDLLVNIKKKIEVHKEKDGDYQENITSTSSKKNILTYQNGEYK